MHLVFTVINGSWFFLLFYRTKGGFRRRVSIWGVRRAGNLAFRDGPFCWPLIRDCTIMVQITEMNVELKLHIQTKPYWKKKHPTTKHQQIWMTNLADIFALFWYLNVEINVDNSHPWILLRFPSPQLHLTPSLLLQPNCHNEKNNK